jgi:type I restriction enzyme S subunit
VVAIIEAAFERAVIVDRNVQEANEETNSLEQSVLRKAFRGKLVPQDPNDEPASVLLERIRTQRVAMGKKISRRKLEELASPAAITTKA